MSIYNPRPRDEIIAEIRYIEQSLFWLQEELLRRDRIDHQAFHDLLNKTRIEGDHP